MGFPSPLARGYRIAPAPVGVAPQARIPPLPVLSARSRHAQLWVGAGLVVVLLGLVAYFLRAVGPAASVIGMIVALVPLTAVLVAVHYIDRWEPEPRSMTVLAVAWGAIAAVAVALGVDALVLRVFGSDGSTLYQVLQDVVQAPLVEELAKGSGVFLLYVTARRAFDGPVDGIVCGALVGAGFAFTENIQYFALSVIDGGAGQLTATFLLRGILSPFAHVMFTSVTGFAVGLAARRGGRVRDAVGPWLLGVLGAAALHALWNASAEFLDFFVLYATLQVPLFALFVTGILLLRREERRLTRERLGEYAVAGWFTRHEVDMLATPHGRRAAMAWSRGLRGDRRQIMRGFIADATRLATARQRIIGGRDPSAAADEHVLLQRTVAARQALFAP